MPAPYWAGVDGVRGLAILLVMGFHFRFLADGQVTHPWYRLAADGGWIGVDLFLVVSGFLITTVLRRARQRPHYFRTFYARRAFRLLPLYLLVVTTVLVAGSWFLDPVRISVARTAQWALWTHTTNWLVARRGWGALGYLGFTWSLALEEQFYLIWPLCVRWLSTRRLFWLSGVLALASFGARTALPLDGWSYVAKYTLTFCRLEPLACGAALALVSERPSCWRRMVPWAPWVAGASFLCFVSLWRLTGHWSQYNATMQAIGYPMVALLGAALVIMGVRANQPRWSPWGWPALQWFGRRCYALYLTHTLLHEFLLRQPLMWTFWRLVRSNSPMGTLVSMAFEISLTALLAAIAWQLIERPLLARKEQVAPAV